MWKHVRGIVIAFMGMWMAIGFTAKNVNAQATERAAANAASRVLRDIPYAVVDNRQLLLDLYMPSVSERPPLVVWIHGGAWRSGSKKEMPLTDLVSSGFAVASVDYRLSTEAKFPALVHDCKAALRFLRASGQRFGFNAERLGVAGSSAGGHLAALVGVSHGVPELEGRIGEHLDQSTAVHAILDMYGPTNFMTILKQSTPHGLSVREPALELLLGGLPDQQTALAKLASPVYHVDARDPPLLMIHGDQDPQVPINQSHELSGKYMQHHLEAHFEVVYGGAHGGDDFFDSLRTKMIREFFSKHLRSTSSQ